MSDRALITELCMSTYASNMWMTQDYQLQTRPVETGSLWFCLTLGLFSAPTLPVQGRIRNCSYK